MSALCEFVEMLNCEGTSDLINRLQFFQKRLKYGLPTKTATALYELGFSDRVIAQELSVSLKLTIDKKNRGIGEQLKQNPNAAKEIIKKYPVYFQKHMETLLQ